MSGLLKLCLTELDFKNAIEKQVDFSIALPNDSLQTYETKFFSGLYDKMIYLHHVSIEDLNSPCPPSIGTIYVMI